MQQSSIISRLRATGRKEHLWTIASGIGIAVGVSSLLLLSITLLESIAHGGIAFRTALWWIWVIGTASVAGGLLGLPIAKLLGLTRSDSVETLALRVGEAYPDVRDNLSNAIQLSESAKESGSTELAEAAFEQSASVAAGKDFSVIIDKKKTRTALIFGTAVLGTVALFLLLAPFASDALDRIRQHDKSFTPPPPFSLEVSPGESAVMRGENTAITIVSSGTRPQTITLWIKERNAERYTPYPLDMEVSDTLVYQLPGLRSSVAYYAASPWFDEDVASDTGKITVIDLPLVRTLNGRVIPPAYTQLPPILINEQQADVTALKGSIVDLQVVSNKGLTKAQVIVERYQDSSTVDSTVVSMEVSKGVATGRFTVAANGTYHIRLTDEDGRTNAQPVKYGIVSLTDGFPTIAMMDPTKDVDVDQEAKLPITLAIADDYGFKSLRLHYRLLRSRYSAPEKTYQSVDIPIAEGKTTLDVGYVWDLGEVGITPDDIYEFYIEVADNDIVNGPKTARTSAYKVRLPSLEELFAETDKAQSQIQKDLQQLLKESEQVRKEADELQREMQKQQAQSKKQTEWQERKKAEELAKKQEELQKKMEEVTDRLEEVTQKLEQNQALSEETLQKYKELQELMRQVKSPELERMREQMKEAMENVSPEEMEKMMQQFKFDEEQFKKNIERTMNLLKRIQAEQKTDELAKRAEELAERQDELRKKAENTNPNDQKAKDQLAKEQAQLEKDLQELAKASDELQKMMEELGADMPTDMMQNAKEELDADQTAADMKSAEQQMQDGDMQSASDKQKNASQNLQRFAQQMQQMKKQMNRNANKQNMRQMQKGMQDISELSKQQEELSRQMRSMDPSSQQFSQAAQQQQKIQQSMQNIANNMMQLSQKSTSVSPELAKDLGEALQQMQNAMQQMQGRNGQMAQRSQQGAMKSMNSAAKKMGDALGSMMRGEGQGQGGQGQNPGMGKGQGKSPFQKLQDLAQQQQGINGKMGKMGKGGGSGGQLTPEQQAEMGRLAAQQGKALKALEELEKERQDVGGAKKPIGDLDPIAEDMKEVLTDMQTGSITPETRMRQERILSRLLNASRSLNERDYEKTRESRTGTDVRRESPDPLQLGAEAKSMRTLMDELRKGYTKDYENLIRSYFEVLQKRRVDVEAAR